MNPASSLFNSFGIFAETVRCVQKSRNCEHLTQLKSYWANEMLRRLKVSLKVKGRVETGKHILFVGNHISYLDIPILMSCAMNVSFVAKKELSNWPVFGAAARRIDTVFVDRQNSCSRQSAKNSIKQSLSRGSRIAIFPSGTTCLKEGKQWKQGAFEIAKEVGALVQPFRISYFPLRTVAYIDKDLFFVHLLRLLGEDKVSAEIEFREPFYVKDPILDCQRTYEWSRGVTSGESSKV